MKNDTSAVPGLSKREAIDLLFSIGKTEKQVTTRTPFQYVLELIDKTYKAGGFEYILKERSRLEISKDTLNIFRDILKLPKAVTIFIGWGGRSFNSIQLWEAGKIYGQKKMLAKANEEDLIYLAQQQIIYDISREHLRKAKNLFCDEGLSIKEAIDKSWLTPMPKNPKTAIITGKFNDQIATQILYKNKYNEQILRGFLLKLYDDLKNCPKDKLTCTLSGNNFSIVGPTQFIRPLLSISKDMENDFVKYIKEEYE